MHSRIKSLTLVLLIAVAIFLMAPGLAVAQSPSLDNFTIEKKYPSNQFRDVSTLAWYYNDVKSAYQMGLIKGKSTNYFDPSGQIKISETIALAARIHSIYNTGSGYFDQEVGDFWYQVYVDYALGNDIIDDHTYSNYDKAINRAQFAAIMINAIDNKDLADINSIADIYIFDISKNASYKDDVYKLYRAGILQGSTKCGDFLPSNSIKRSEVAAIINRMAIANNRIAKQSHDHSDYRCHDGYEFPSPMSNEALSLINEERYNAGRPLLRAESKHYNAAYKRAFEIKTCWGDNHPRPDGSTWKTVLSQYNISWNYCGENIAREQTSADQVFNELWNSSIPSHRGNFLNANFKKIGIGYSSYGNGYAWSFIFTN